MSTPQEAVAQFINNIDDAPIPSDNEELIYCSKHQKYFTRLKGTNIPCPFDLDENNCIIL